MIRPYSAADFESVTRLWRRAREVAFPEFMARHGHTFEEDQAYFREVVLPHHSVWVASHGYMAMAGDFIDQLYVDPDHQRQGVGHALLAHARGLSPSRLRLFTFQSNRAGRAFYEKEGFRAVRFGQSPAPESEPDVELVWEPGGRPQR